MSVAPQLETPAYPWLRAYPPNIDYFQSFEPSPLYRLLDQAVADYPDNRAVDFMNKTWTYRQIGSLVDRFAAGLQSLGVGKGVQVGLFLPNCPLYPIAYFAILKAGGTVVNYNPRYPERELRYQINNSHTKIMVTLDLKATLNPLLPLIGETELKQVIVAPMASFLPFPKNLLFPLARRKDVAQFRYGQQIFSYEKLLNVGDKPSPVQIDPVNDVAVLQYTGGTTGVPKGAMLTHANLYVNALQSAAWFPDVQKGKERILGILPFFHVFAMTSVQNMILAIGGEILIYPLVDLKKDLPPILDLIQKKRPTLFPAVPTVYSAINNFPGIENYDLRSIRACNSGGAPLPVEVKSKFEEMTGCALIEGYGLSESAPVATVNPIQGVNKPGSIGLPIPGTIVEIVSIEDGTTVLPVGEVGEICLRGPQIMKGYFENPEETAKTLRNGRLHTGDVGRLDEEGYGYITDRLKDMIIAGGFNIYPRNVEEAIYLHQAVEEVIVAGLKDPYRGETVKAWVKFKEGQSATEAELRAFLKDKLSPYEVPKQWEFRTTPLPKTAIGKLSKKMVLDEEAARAAAATTDQPVET